MVWGEWSSMSACWLFTAKLLSLQQISYCNIDVVLFRKQRENMKTTMSRLNENKYKPIWVQKLRIQDSQIPTSLRHLWVWLRNVGWTLLYDNPDVILEFLWFALLSLFSSRKSPCPSHVSASRISTRVPVTISSVLACECAILIQWPYSNIWSGCYQPLERKGTGRLWPYSGKASVQCPMANVNVVKQYFMPIS